MDPKLTVDPYDENDWPLNEEDKLERLRIGKRASIYKVVQPQAEATPKAITKTAKATEKASPVKLKASGSKSGAKKGESRGEQKVEGNKQIHEVEEYGADETDDDSIYFLSSRSG